MSALPPRSNRRQARASLGSCIIAIALLFAIAIWQVLLLPRFIIPIFDDFHIEIPWLMGRLIALPANSVILFTGLATAALVIKEALLSRKRLTRTINLSAVLLMLVYASVFTYVCLTTCVTLMQSNV